MNSWKYAELAEKLNPIDDEFFRKMAEDAALCEEILQVILEDAKLRVQEVIPQKSIKNLQGRSIILDALCLMGDNTYCNVEVQKENDDDHLRRVRYNEACITANISDTGIKFKGVPDVCIVFISRFDIFHGNRVIYHVDSIVRETGELLDDGMTRVFVNAKIKDNSDISDLMSIFTEDKTYDFNRFPKTSARKQQFKEREEGKEEMSEIMRKIAELERAEGRNEGRNEGRSEGILDKTKTVIKNMLQRGFSDEDIMGLAECNLDTLEEVRRSMV